MCYNQGDSSNESLKKRGGGNMTNKKRLEEKIAMSGKKKGHLSKKCGLSHQGFLNCINGKAEFNARQIQALCDELNITSLKEKDAIFFAK